MTAYVRATLRKLTLWYEHSVTIMVVLQRETYSDVREQEEEFDACELSDGYASTEGYESPDERHQATSPKRSRDGIKQVRVLSTLACACMHRCNHIRTTQVTPTEISPNEAPKKALKASEVDMHITL